MADTRDQLQAGLGGQYTLERELGRGGMATVYLARDVKHQRQVALKVLNAELAVSLGSERFRREITTAAQLQHPHILGVFDSGVTPAGQLWFTMPFIDGESLRDRLRRDGQLPIEDALRIAREVAGALAFAHSRSVIHRDVKPENIMLSRQGDALLADFGIARALPGSGDGVTLTVTGVTIGTPQYMSPEQAAGDVLSARSDVYNLGAVLYEMLTGEPPHVGGTIQAVVTKILTTDAPPVRALRPGVAPGLDQAVGRALARLPADRFASAEEFSQALSTVERTGATNRGLLVWGSSWSRIARPALAVLVVVAAIVLGFRYLRFRGPVATQASLMTLAVLPFDTEGDTADAFLADGITNEIRGKLSSLPTVRLIASASSNQYRHTVKPQVQIARELGVRYLLTGSVTWEHEANGVRRVRVQPELVEVEEGLQPAIKWRNSYDTTLTDLFDLQSAIATRVAEKLDVALSPSATTRLDARPTQKVAAYDAYLHSGYVGIDPATLRRALVRVERAIALDSNYSDAWARLSLIHSTLIAVTPSTPVDAAMAKQAADRAVALAPSSPYGYIARGFYSLHVRNDRPAARLAYETALRVSPSSAEANQGLEGVDAALGDFASALDQARRAVALDPRAPVATRDLCWVLLWLRRYPQARDAAEHGLALAPSDLDMIEVRTISQLGEGDLAGARKVLSDVPSTLDRASLLAYVSSYWDLYWVLDSADRAMTLTLPVHSFDDDKGQWAMVRAEVARLQHDEPLARRFADTASVAYAARAAAGDFQGHLFHGLMLARLGRAQAAEAEGVLGAAMADSSGDHFGAMAYAHHVLARIYVATGNHPKALDELEALFAKPYFMSPAWLGIDPNWAPLAGDPRFERLVAAR